MKQTDMNEMKVISKKLDDACFIDFGTRVVQKKDGGAIFPVYGGGGATFKMNTYNRENCLVVSRFAMSKQCTRFVEGKFYLNDSGLTVRPKNEKELAQVYLDYLLLTLNDTIYSLSRGTAQRNLNVPKFRKLEIKYPDSIEYQLHIANLLSKAENLIAQRKESIRLLDEFLKSTFLEMFGDPVRNEMGWIKDPLNRAINGIDSGWSPVCLNKSRNNNSEWAILKLSSVTYRKFNPFENKLLDQCIKVRKVIVPKKGDLLFSRKNTYQLVGAAAFVFEDQEKLLLPDTIFRINYKSEKIQGLFLWFLINDLRFRNVIQSLASGAAGSMPNISKDKLNKLKIPIPPYSLQTQFAQIVEKTEALKTQYRQSLQELENLYGSLSQKAFNGELGIKEESALSSAESRSMAAEQGRSMAAEPGVGYKKG
jgi:restriction endonuclease S subunit